MWMWDVGGYEIDRRQQLAWGGGTGQLTCGGRRWFIHARQISNCNPFCVHTRVHQRAGKINGCFVRANNRSLLLLVGTDGATTGHPPSSAQHQQSLTRLARLSSDCLRALNKVNHLPKTAYLQNAGTCMYSEIYLLQADRACGMGISQKLFVIFCNRINTICRLQSHRLWSHAVVVTPPQAATKIMAGIAELSNGRKNGRMAENG